MSMQQVLRLGAALCVLVALSSCSSTKPAAPEPRKTIDAGQFYMGRWYEIARAPMKLTDGCVAGTTDFYRTESGTLMDRDACRMGTPAGEEKWYGGPVTILNPGDNTKISIRYTVWGFVPVWRTYWMLDHDDRYEWFILSDPAFESVSIFTRTPQPSKSTVERLTGLVRELGYDPAKLEFPTQF